MWKRVYRIGLFSVNVSVGASAAPAETRNSIGERGIAEAQRTQSFFVKIKNPLFCVPCASAIPLSLREFLLLLA